MTTEAFKRVKLSYWLNATLNGIYAGLVGGYLLGSWMGLAGILPMVGKLFNLDRDWASFLIHGALSAFFGGVFAILAVRFHFAVLFHLRFRKTIPIGMTYGLILWFFNILILIPILFGSQSNELTAGINLWILLFGHIGYGIVTAMMFTIFYWKTPRIHIQSRGRGYWTEYFLSEEKQEPGSKKKTKSENK